MPKTDKEITSEIVCTYINAWFSRTTNSSLTITDIKDLISTVYSTVESLENTHN